jgi:hypothetical protein
LELQRGDIKWGYDCIRTRRTHKEEREISALERDLLRGPVAPTCSWEQRGFWDPNDADDSCRKFGIFEKVNWAQMY